MKRLTKTQLFIDGGDPKETAEATRLLNEAGYAGLDGQTTNPSLVAKNPEIAAQIQTGEKLSREELLAKYQEIVQSIEKNAPGAISIEVYADQETTASEMVAQAREMARWIASAVIKLPTTPAGLQAAEIVKGEMRLNLTLCFSQQQAAAVYAATRGSAYPVFVSPFVGRLDDAGWDGTQHVANVLKMYREGDGHVHVLSASFRWIESVLEVLRLQTHAVTINFKLFEPWAKQRFPLPDENFHYQSDGKPIPYEEGHDLSSAWQTFDWQHDLTDAGLKKFADDWNSLIQ